MKFITRVTATNLKNRATLDIQLARLSIITGRNGSGKTSIADAIALASLGYIPSLGKSGPAIAKAAGPGLEMGAALEMTDLPDMVCRFDYARTWKRTAAGMKKVTAPEDTAPAIPIICLDPDAFLNASAASRAQAIAARFEIEGDPKEKIRAAIAAVAAGHDIPTAPKIEDFSEWVNQWESDISEALKEANASARRMKATIEGMAALDETPPATVPAETIKKAQQEVGACSARISAIANQKATAREQHAEKMAAFSKAPECPEISRQKLEAELAEIMAEISALEAKERKAKDTDGTRARDAANLSVAEKRLAGIEHWLEQNPEPEPYACEALPEPQDLGKLNEAQQKAYEEMATAAAALEAINANPLTGTHCPCCGAAAASWDQDKVWKAEELKLAAEVRHDKAKEAHRRALALYEEACRVDDRRESQRIEAMARAKITEERKTYASRASETAQLIESLNAKLAEAPHFEQEDAELLESLRNDRRQIIVSIDEWKAYEEAAKLSNEINELAETIRLAELASEAAYNDYDVAVANAKALEAQAEAAAAAVANAQTHAAATKEFDKATELASVLNAARETLRESAEAETLKIFTPLLAIAGPICAGCLPTPLDHKGLEFGRYEGPHFINLDTFSKSEKAAALAGISAALAAKSAGVLIVDEFNNLDAAKREQFLTNLADAIEANTIAQAILLDNSPQICKLPEFGSQQALEA